MLILNPAANGYCKRVDWIDLTAANDFQCARNELKADCGAQNY